MALFKWIIEQNSMLIYLSVRLVVRPTSLEMIPNQIATAHLQKGLLAPGRAGTPAMLFRLSLEGGSHLNKGLRY